MLSSIIRRSRRDSSRKVDLDNVTFVSNDRLLEMMSRTTATPEQVEAALQINADARLRALKLTFLLLTGLGLLAFVPAGRLPGYERLATFRADSRATVCRRFRAPGYPR